MMTDIITMGSYGIFVWSAFIITFICCFYLYLKTKKGLKKQEKIFLNKINNLSAEKIIIAKEKEATQQILVGSLKFNP